MGLAGPKNRTKISADPNNTHWSKSTDRFGHKILLKQGWTPGSFLGAKDAKHASHYTAANASHIRVAVKDDTLGLGAKRGKAENETFGLSAFQGLLGRLNGKSDGELKKEESAQRDLKLQVYTNQRWGGIRFVSGGLLVGDKIEDLANKDSAAPAASAKRIVAEVENTDPVAADKKRKRSEDDESESSLKGKKRKSDLKKNSDQSSQDDNEKKKSRSKKPKKSNGEEPSIDNASAEEKEDGERLSKKARREAKKARKLERLTKKESKESKRADKEKRKRKKDEKTVSTKDSSSSEDEFTPSTSTSVPASGTSTPTVGFAGGRLAVRQRYIAQKKKASMDPQALKEIFMIKSEA